MVRSVDGKDSVDVYRRLSLHGYGSVHVIGAKRDLRIALALENLPVHFAITHAVSAVTAPGIHQDFTRDLASSSIQTQRTLLQAEGSVNRVERTAERVIYSRVFRVELKYQILRGSRDAAGREKRNRPQELQARSALVRWGVGCFHEIMRSAGPTLESGHESQVKRRETSDVQSQQPSKN